MSQDSWAKDDMPQQEAFQRETAKLWKFAQGSDLFAFRTVQDVLAENKELRDEIKCLNTVLNQNITELQKDIKQTQLATDDAKSDINILNLVY